jgi:hypothetical protein
MGPLDGTWSNHFKALLAVQTNNSFKDDESGRKLVEIEKQLNFLLKKIICFILNDN